MDHLPDLPCNFKLSDGHRRDPLVGECYICWLVCFWLFYALATSEVISGRVPIYASAHLWRLYSASQLGHHAVGTVT